MDKPIERDYLRMLPVLLSPGEWYLQVRHGLTGDWETKQHFTRDGLVKAMESLLEDVTDITAEVIGVEIERQQEEQSESESESLEDQGAALVRQWRRRIAPKARA